MRYCVFLMLCAFLVSCAAAPPRPHKHDAFTKHYDESLFQVTAKGMFGVEMVVKEHELRTGINMVDLIIHDKNDRDVVGAQVELTPWMPDMGHGVFDKPVITEKGGGLYTVDNIILIMSGHWELRVNVKSDAVEDTAVFDFPDVKVDRGHDHKAVQAPAPSDLDLSRTRDSETKIFKVSYRSDLHPPPINQIHSWALKVVRSDGRPVKNAEISIDGDMPEHGHGLPTQPEVTEDLGEGRYLVEGMKFSMPGWWILQFHIVTAVDEDTVTFNLILEE